MYGRECTRKSGKTVSLHRRFPMILCSRLNNTDILGRGTSWFKFQVAER